MGIKMFTKSKKPEKHRWNTADTITSVRIVFSLVLPFLTLYSVWFFVVYTITGLTDALDGWIARKTGMDSEFGAKLDSVADLLLYSVLLIRFFPVLAGGTAADLVFSGGSPACAVGSLCCGGG